MQNLSTRGARCVRLLAQASARLSAFAGRTALATAFAVAGMAAMPADGVDLDGTAVIGKMKLALEPHRPSVRRSLFEVGSAAGSPPEVLIGEARRPPIGGPGRALVVVLAPASLQGTAFLIQEAPAAMDQWVYVPVIARVRRILAPEAFTAFLNSDFTYSDLGFVDVRAAHTLAGEETRDGVRTYRIESVPRETWWYSRILTWVRTDSFLPVERHFFSPAGDLWKIQRWQDVTVVDGVATPLHVSMEDVPGKTRTDIRIKAIDYDVDVPEAFFDPVQIPTAAQSAIWKGVEDSGTPMP